MMDNKMDMKDSNGNGLIIIGASGHGKVVADIAINMGLVVVGFLDDNPKDNCVCNIPVLGMVSDVVRFPKCQFVMGIGSNAIREKIDHMYSLKWATLVHPTASIGIDAEIKEGSVIAAQAVIGPSAKVGRHCIINTSASIDHDCFLDNYVHVSPGAHISGTVNIGSSTWIGTGCSICNNISIGRQCIIGAGAVVIQDINEPGTYVGIPAKKIKGARQ